jgi:hypothetical protein
VTEHKWPQQLVKRHFVWKNGHFGSFWFCRPRTYLHISNTNIQLQKRFYVCWASSHKVGRNEIVSLLNHSKVFDVAFATYRTACLRFHRCAHEVQTKAVEYVRARRSYVRREPSTVPGNLTCIIYWPNTSETARKHNRSGAVLPLLPLSP